MSNPSFSNIDLWLFELAEGNLSAAQIEQLELFLLHHPELEVEKDVWEMAKISATPLAFEGQEKLERRKPIGWYATLGIVSLLLVGSLVGYGYLQWDANKSVLSAMQTSESQVREKLAQEIYWLKSNREVKEINNKAEGERTVAQSVLNSKDVEIASNSMNMPARISQSVVVNSANQNTESVMIASNQTVEVSSVVMENANSEISNESSISNEISIQNEVGLIESTSTREEPEISPVSIENNLIAESNVNENEVNKSDLFTNTDEEVDVLDESFNVQIARNQPNTHTFSSDNYKVSFKSRINKFSRAVQRMMDNPVALENYRDPYYHVPGMLPNDVNFSSAGTMLSTRIQATSRLQWYGKENQQLLSQLAVDGYAHGMRGGIGFQLNHALYNDGGVNIAGAALTYSPKFSVTKKLSVEPSLRFKMGNKALTKSKMEDVDVVELDRGNSHDFYTGGEQLIGTDQWYKDLGAGLMVNTQWFFAGFQVDNLFRHKDNIYSYNIVDPRRSDYHFIGTVGTDWVSKRENFSVSPYLVYQKMEKLSEAWLGVNCRMNWLTLGGAISSNLEPSGSIGIKFDHFALTYNADYTNSQMLGSKALSHQLTIRFVSKPSRFGNRILNH